MDQNTQIKIEFFELCRQLNRSNVHANQKTEISFFIEAVGNKSILYATTNKAYKIQIIFQKGNDPWRGCEFSGLINLESELCNFFSTFDAKKKNKSDLTKSIKSFIFKHFSE